jgi:hypothetical protein
MANYLSKYSNGKTVSEAQYITELICENKAKKDKEDLHYRFWISKKWENFYKNQIASAHKLLKQYTAKAIISAIKNEKSKNTYSLRSPFLLEIIKQAQSDINKENNELTLKLNRKENIKFDNKNKKSNGLLSKLKDIENES